MKIWKSIKYELEVDACCKTEAVVKINKILLQLKMYPIGMSDVYLLNETEKNL